MLYFLLFGRPDRLMSLFYPLATAETPPAKPERDD